MSDKKSRDEGRDFQTPASVPSKHDRSFPTDIKLTNGSIAVDGKDCRKGGSKRITRTSRPSLEIYRPPGLRSGSTDCEVITAISPTPIVHSAPKLSNSPKISSENSKPQLAAGSKQSTTTSSTSPEKRPKTPTLKQQQQQYQQQYQQQRPLTPQNGAEKSGEETTPPPMGTKTPPRRGQSPGPPRMPSRSNSFVKDTPKKKGLSSKDAEDVRKMFATLEIPESTFLTQYSEGNFESRELASPTAQLLVQAAIEEGKTSKAVAKLCSLLMDAHSGDVFHQGLVASCWQYFECRDKLRAEHFRFWLAFLNFVSDLYTIIGFTYEGELVEILFRVFDYLLQNPTLETLKIEELECLISSLLSVGYDLERQCPDQLVLLRDRIRDAFIQAHEPWARKMILLLVELSASSWKLPADANEYYFQTSVH